jgi:hypothetical protein
MAPPRRKSATAAKADPVNSSRETVLVSRQEGCPAVSAVSASAESKSSLAKGGPIEASDPLALQPGETELQHRRFVLWLASNADGGPRSFTKVALQEGVAESVIRESARSKRWLQRAAVADRAAIGRELSAGMDVQRRSIIAQVQLGERLVRVLEGIVDELARAACS